MRDTDGRKMHGHHISSIAYFAPMEKAADFTVEDFYQLVAEERSVKQLCTDVVIVDIDTCQRAQIAEIIEAVDYCAPAAVGLDIFFDYPSAHDDALIVTRFGKESGTPSLLVPPGQAAQVPGYLFAAEGHQPADWLLIASELPFDSQLLQQLIQRNAPTSTTPAILHLPK